MESAWRVGGAVGEGELVRRLEEASRLSPSFEEATTEEMTVERGWNQVRSDAVIAQEPVGPVVEDGPFARARHALTWFEFSDPRIVRPHFDARAPLRGRTLILELRAAGLSFFSPIRVGSVIDEVTGDATTFGIALETLPGHIERGREWLVLIKEHRTGLVRFCIRAAWQSGDLPNAWSWFGFQLLARRYQRAWHHLAHARLRALASDTGTLPSSPVQFNALRARGTFDRSIEVEQEIFRGDGVLTAAGLAALCGARSMAPLAVLKAVDGSVLAPVFAAAALGEFAADKLPFTPDRTALLPLLGRAAMGATVAASVERKANAPRAAVALTGAAAAVAGAFATVALRRRLGEAVSNAAAGLIEDALVVGAAVALVHRARRR